MAPSSRKRGVSPTSGSSSGIKRMKKAYASGDSGQKRLGRQYSKYGIEHSLPPMTSLNEMFADIVSKALDTGLGTILQSRERHLNLTVATMCSGTDSPIFALNLMKHELEEQGFRLQFQHLFSAEIEAWKQAFIERNFNPSICFGDIGEFKSGQGTTMYGGKRRLPKCGQVDILMAGFPCVDLSNLNSEHRSRSKGFSRALFEAFVGTEANLAIFEDLLQLHGSNRELASLFSAEDKGSEQNSSRLEKTGKVGVSGTAFLAIFRYVDEYRPPIVLLENLNGAPWETLKKVFGLINYSAAYARINTRDYYLPQVRKRGYMICINNDISNGCKGLHPEEAHSKVEQWCSLMKTFERPASSSAEEFLLPPDHPILRKAMNAISRTEESKSDTRAVVDWSVCEGRHQRHRQDKLLGVGVPYTKWNRGAVIPPSYANVQWIRIQSDRVQDCLDMVALENAIKEEDIQYKFHVADVSQNIDRGLEPSAAGVVGCITPSGCPFLSLRGAPITGLEALVLQGLPLERLMFAQETEAQLRDLAGNAMSSTVIGAGILAAIMVGHRAFPRQLKEPARLDLDLGDQEASVQLSGPNAMRQIASLASLPATSLPLAYLNKVAESSRITCECERRWDAQLPLLLECPECMTLLCSRCAGNPTHSRLLQHSHHDRQRPERFTSLISDALPPTLSLDICVQDFLTVTEPKRLGQNEKTHYQFILALSHALGEEMHFKAIKRSTYWYAEYESEGQSLRLSFRAAGTEWQLFVKPVTYEPAVSETRSLLSRPVAKCELRDAGSTNLLAGQWEIRLPTCTQILGVVTGYGRLRSSWKSRLGLVEDQFKSERVWDEILLTSNDVTASIQADRFMGNYRLLPECGTANGALHTKVVQHRTDGTYEPLYLFLDPLRTGDPNLDLFVISNEHERLGFKEYRGAIAHMTLPKSNNGHENPKKVTIKAQPSGGNRSNGQRHVRKVPNRKRGREKSKEVKSPALREWRPSMEEEQLVQITVFDTWVPSKSQLQIPRDSRDTSILAPGISRFAFDMTSTETCHNALKIVLKCRIPWFGRNPDGRSSSQNCTITEGNQMGMKIDLRWLAKQVEPLLQDASKWMAIGTNDAWEICGACTPQRPELRWRVMQVGARNRVRKAFVPNIEPQAASRYELLLRNRPSSFALNLLAFSPLTGSRTVEIGVRPNVLVHRAITRLPRAPPMVVTGPVKASWRVAPDAPSSALKSEHYTILSSKQGRSRAFHFPTTKYRLRHDQERSLYWMTRRDGPNPPVFQEIIVEESVSFHLGWKFEAKATRDCYTRGGIIADDVGYGKTVTTLALIMSTLKDSYKPSKSSRPLVFTNATLIVVPNTLVEQWANEIRKFCPQSNCLVVNDFRDLSNITVKAVRQADIVLMSVSLLDFVKSPRYIKYVADFAMVGTPPTKSALARYSAWWQIAVGKLRHRMASFKARSKMGLPLHAFVFKRKVIDEQSYLSPGQATGIRALESMSTWAMSATLRLKSFRDVQRLASLLGVHLTMPDLAGLNARRDASREIEHEKTRSHVYQASRSFQSHSRNVKLQVMAQRFLDSFARCNRPNIHNIRMRTTVAPIALGGLHEAIYLELQAQLLAGNAKYSKSGKNNEFFAHDRRKRLMHLLSLSRTYEEALVKSIHCLPAPEDIMPTSKKLRTDAHLTWDQLLCAREANIDHFKGLILRELALINVFRLDLGRGLYRHMVVKHGGKFHVAMQRTSGMFEHDPRQRLGDAMAGSVFRALRMQIVEGEHSASSSVMVGPEEARKNIDNITRLGKSLTASIRALRYLRTVQAIQDSSITNLSQNQGLRLGSRCQCDLTAQKEFAINQQCGHIICGSCSKIGTKSDRCSENCDASIAKVNFLTHKDISTSAHERLVPHCWKALAIVDFIKSTRDSDQVLIFCQFKDIADPLFAMLKGEGFVIHAPKSHDAGKVLTGFHATKFGSKEWFKVVMLDPLDASAAGHNLTNVTKVIFVSPLLVGNLEETGGFYKQAIGRARRFGQMGEVEVVHCLALNTIEINLFEESAQLTISGTHGTNEIADSRIYTDRKRDRSSANAKSAPSKDKVGSSAVQA